MLQANRVLPWPRADGSGVHGRRNRRRPPHERPADLCRGFQWKYPQALPRTRRIPTGFGRPGVWSKARARSAVHSRGRACTARIGSEQPRAALKRLNQSSIGDKLARSRVPGPTGVEPVFRLAGNSKPSSSVVSGSTARQLPAGGRQPPAVSANRRKPTHRIEPVRPESRPDTARPPGSSAQYRHHNAPRTDEHGPRRLLSGPKNLWSRPRRGRDRFQIPTSLRSNSIARPSVSSKAAGAKR